MKCIFSLFFDHGFLRFVVLVFSFEIIGVGFEKDLIFSVSRPDFVFFIIACSAAPFSLGVIYIHLISFFILFVKQIISCSAWL